LDVEITPIFVETNMHYYRVYVRTLNKADTKNRIGHIMHCRACGHRQAVSEKAFECPQCGSKVEHAGPLWIDHLFEKKFAESMMEEIPRLQVDKKCEKAISKCILESEMPPCYYTLDEIAEMRRSSPIPLANVLDRLREEGFSSSPTSFNPTGFRTDATISKVKEIFSV
jgi:tRNA (guanine26-N2/guanine27-N2)-dimethyltransferase